MSLVVEIVKGVVTVVGGTILVFGALFAVLIPPMLLHERLKKHGQRRRRELAGPSGFGRVRARMSRLARPSLLLVPTKAPGFSKLGGDPELPDSIEWPADHGQPYTFVGQIELAGLGADNGMEWLPHSGRLYAFVNEERYGFPDLVRVVFSTEAAGQARLSPPGAARPFHERRVAFEAYRSLPSLDWLGVDLADLDLSSEELEQLTAAPDAPFGDELQHRIGGYPSEIQDEQMAITCELMRRGLPPEHEGTEITPAIERASKQWRLLLQVDSDPALKMNWGDGGRLYVFIREKDAVAGEFSRTVTISQTY